MKETYEKLVDLYAGEDLPQELMDELEAAAKLDPALSQEMASLKGTVQALKNAPAPEFTQETFHRILMRMYTKGAIAEPLSPEPTHLQLRLPLSG